MLRVLWYLYSRYPHSLVIELSHQRLLTRLFTFNIVCQNLSLECTHVLPSDMAPSRFFSFLTTASLCPFTNIGGQPRRNLCSVDASTGVATTWNPSPNNTIHSLNASEGQLHVGGIFRNLGTTFQPSFARFLVSTVDVSHAPEPITTMLRAITPTPQP